MKMVNERDIDMLLRILDHCDRVFSSISRFGDDYEIYKEYWDYQDVIKMNLFQIGEISNNLSDELRENMSEIPWHQLYGMRNIIAHGYEKVHEEEIWKTIKNDIPDIKGKIVSFLNKLNIDTE